MQSLLVCWNLWCLSSLIKQWVWVNHFADVWWNFSRSCSQPCPLFYFITRQLQMTHHSYFVIHLFLSDHCRSCRLPWQWHLCLFNNLVESVIESIKHEFVVNKYVVTFCFSFFLCQGVFEPQSCLSARLKHIKHLWWNDLTNSCLLLRRIGIRFSLLKSPQQIHCITF